MAIPTRDSSAIQQQGSGNLWIRECSSAGVSSGTWTQFAIFGKTAWTDKAATSTVPDEGGNTYPITGTREAMIPVTMLQRDKNTLGFSQREAKGKYYHIAHRLTPDGRTIGGKHLWLTYGICTVDEETGLSLPGADGPTITFRAQNNNAALTIDGSGITNGPASISIPAGNWYSLDEVAT